MWFLSWAFNALCIQNTPVIYPLPHCRPHFKEAGVILLLVSIQVLWHTELNLHQPITNRF